MAKYVKVRLYPDGRIEAETSQITGKSCMKMIKPIENMLDATVVESSFTPEYYDSNTYVETAQSSIQVQKEDANAGY
jgi:hypothetical protein